MTISKFNWLKLTDGHKFTGAEFRVLISLFNHSDKDGRRAHPGIDLMVEETCYRKTGISEAITALKERGWIHETYRGNGRSRHASEFDLVPDAPNPTYRCGSRRCATCSNGSALAEPLDLNGSAVAEPLEGVGGFNGSALAEPLDLNGSAVAEPLSGNDLNGSAVAEPLSGNDLNGSAVAVPIVPLQRSPSDPVTDPKRSVTRRLDPEEEQVPPSDPQEVRYPPDHVEVRVESPSAGEPLLEAGSITTAAQEPPSSGHRAAITEPAYQSQPATVGDEDLVFGSDLLWDDPILGSGDPGGCTFAASPLGGQSDPWGNPEVPSGVAASNGQPAGGSDPFAGLDLANWEPVSLPGG